jgi:hypothetical protein
MAFNIQEFISRGLTGGGARPSLFQVTMTAPAISGATSTILDKLAFTCKAASIPAAQISAVDVPYFGRKIKLAGDRTYDDWSVTIMNDEDYSVRRVMEAWSDSMNSFASNLRLIGAGTGGSSTNAPSTGYKTVANVVAFGKAGNTIAAYNFFGLFPLTVSNMTMDWDAVNQIQQFDVNFSYDYWEPTNTIDLPATSIGFPPGFAFPNT